MPVVSSWRLANWQNNRWIGVEIAGIVIELYLFWLSVYLVWSLQMSWGSKFIVILAFSFRLP